MKAPELPSLSIDPVAVRPILCDTVTTAEIVCHSQALFPLSPVKICDAAPNGLRRCIRFAPRTAPIVLFLGSDNLVSRVIQVGTEYWTEGFLLPVPIGTGSFLPDDYFLRITSGAEIWAMATGVGNEGFLSVMIEGYEAE